MIGNRTVGQIVCKGCGQTVAVAFVYSNSDRALGIVDHQVPNDQRPASAAPTEFVRCRHAGLQLSCDGAWNKAALASYSPADIQPASKPTPIVQEVPVDELVF
jgi:hypothetical protein